ncbi:MAG: hypothetical protein PVG71_10615 [Anaerolineae bacterium]|jgi:hypothetical protein
MLQIRFWWPGYSLEDALTSFDLTVTKTPFEGSADGGRSWRAPRDGATLQTIHEWMVDHDCTVVDTQLVDERRNGGWEGLYVLTIGRNRR